MPLSSGSTPHPTPTTATTAPAGRPLISQGAGTPESAWAEWGGLERLPEATLERLCPPGHRVVVVAPHPDDEVLGFGGLLGQLGAAGQDAYDVMLVAVTDGAASHPGSKAFTPERLKAIRPVETLAALSALRVNPEVVRLDLADGAVASAESELTGRLRRLLRSGDTVLTTWRGDGHPDHEAVARAVLGATASDRHGHVVEAPVWGWHWASPGDLRIPWSRAQRLTLAPEVVARKRQAISCFRTQVETHEGELPVLVAGTLAHLLRPFETFFVA